MHEWALKISQPTAADRHRRLSSVLMVAMNMHYTVVEVALRLLNRMHP